MTLLLLLGLAIIGLGREDSTCSLRRVALVFILGVLFFIALRRNLL